MKRQLTYTIVLGATLALSFCQGRQSTVFDPLQGQNRQTAAAMINTPVESRTLPESLRSQRYSLSYTTEQADACVNTASETGQVSDFCRQIIYDYFYRIGGPQFQSYFPEMVQIRSPNGGLFDFNLGDQFSATNAPWISQYQNWAGGMNPNAQGYYQTAYPMQNFCNDPSQYTTVQFQTPCGNLNWGYATIALNSNNGMNYMRQGDFNRASNVFAPGGFMALRAPHIYGTVLSNRNVGKENEALTKSVEASWENMKGLPKNWGLTILNRVMDTATSIPTNMVSRLDAKLAGVAANQYGQAAYNQQMSNYYDMVSNQYLAAQQMSQIATVQAMEPKNPCPGNKYVYTVGPQPTTNGEYRVLTCGE